MKFNVNRLIKKLIMVAFIIYFIITIFNQQQKLDDYKSSIAIVEKQIEEKTEYKESLVNLKENATSLEYIEKIAREKLDMYYPNERVYIDGGM